MQLTDEQAQQARRNRLAYEANMAVENLHIHPEDRVIIERLDDEKIGYEDGIKLILAHLRKRGVIPSDEEKSNIAAE